MTGLERDPAGIRPFPEQALFSAQQRSMDYTGRRGDCDPQRTFMPAGRGSGLIHEVRPADTILRQIIAEAESLVAEKFAGASEPLATHVGDRA